MVADIFCDVTLAWQLLWNRQRRPAGVQLVIEPHGRRPLQASHLLDALTGLWTARSLPLLLSTPSAELQRELLELAAPTLARIEVPQAWLRHPPLSQRVAAASQRGLQLVVRAQPGGPPTPGDTRQSILSLDEQEALRCLQLVLRRKKGRRDAPALLSPVLSGQIYDGVASRALAEHCLDQQAASALLGWPVEDVLHGYRLRHIQPGQAALQQVLAVIHADASIDQIEHCISQEPMLVYRFLHYVNSAEMGARRGITSLRHGLMVLGLGRLTLWLPEQLAHAATDLNLQPVATGMVLRARFMAELLDAGADDALRREIYLCGLLSQMDVLLGQSLAQALHTLTLPERLTDALLNQCGPYWAYLDMATQLETGRAQVTLASCQKHNFDLESVNLALLGTLCALRFS